MRILVVSQHFWPESFRINEVADDLVRAGHDVVVLTGQPNYPAGRVFDGYRAWRSGAERHGGVEIERVPLVPRGRASALRLVANYLSFIVSATLVGAWRLRGRPFDVVFVYATSLISVCMILASGLSFLGLGTRPPEPEWGLMLNTLRTAIYVQPWVAVLPGACIFVTSICFNLLSDGLRQAMDVKG